MQSDRTTPPKRIWVPLESELDWLALKDPHNPEHEYILASEVATLIAEAEAQGRDCGIGDVIEAMQNKLAHWGETEDLLDWIAPGQTLIAEVAAIRAAKGYPT